jgi:hypothetical protein
MYIYKLTQSNNSKLIPRGKDTRKLDTTISLGYKHIFAVLDTTDLVFSIEDDLLRGVHNVSFELHSCDADVFRHRDIKGTPCSSLSFYSHLLVTSRI